jgi:hypothetical protein
VGALPILNHIFHRLNREAILQAHLPHEEARTNIPSARGLLVLVKNFLLSREPLYGLGEWAVRHDATLLRLTPEQIGFLNDDRAGRWLTRFFCCARPAFLLDPVSHTVVAFAVGLDELPNDATTVSFYGAYTAAAAAKQRQSQKTLAITRGHSKDHRPDLKQLLYSLTSSTDGGVPVYCRAASGNVTDDSTHQDSWKLLCPIAGRRDFL